MPTCPSVVEWIIKTDRYPDGFIVYLRCEVRDPFHVGKHRNRHGKSWRDDTQYGQIQINPDPAPEATRR